MTQFPNISQYSPLEVLLAMTLLCLDDVNSIVNSFPREINSNNTGFDMKEYEIDENTLKISKISIDNSVKV